MHSWAEQTSFKQTWWYSFVCSYSHTHTQSWAHKPAVRWNQIPGNTHLTLCCIFEQFIKQFYFCCIISAATSQNKKFQQSVLIFAPLPHFRTSPICVGIPPWFLHKRTQRKGKSTRTMRLAVKKYPNPQWSNSKYQPVILAQLVQSKQS